MATLETQASSSLFLQAEKYAQEFNLFPSADPDAQFSVRGLVPKREVDRRIQQLANLDIDQYIESAVSPAEMPDRENAPSIVLQLGKVLSRTYDGPYFDAVVEMVFEDGVRPVAFIAQDRRHRNGEWMPEHHLAAAEFATEVSRRRMPIVTFMDTLGAAGDEMANRGNQAHSISRLIAVMSDVVVPNIGIIYGIGYSGGAIPLAASNMILSLRDGVFSTIQPRSLANIARRLNLSWQECAKHVGISAFELMHQGNIDGIIDYVPDEQNKIENLRLAITTGITSVEASSVHFVASSSFFVENYRQALRRFIAPSPHLAEIERAGRFHEHSNSTEYHNIFGDSYRYLRYLRVRRRIKAISANQFSRLSTQALPSGELAQRADRDRRQTFLRWVQDPDQIRYEDALKNAWKSFLQKRETRNDEPGRVQRLMRVDYQKNFEVARASLLREVGKHLYNRWKTDASANLQLLREFLEKRDDFNYLFSKEQLTEARSLLDNVRQNDKLNPIARSNFTAEGKKLLYATQTELQNMPIDALQSQLTIELNLLLTGSSLGAVEKNLASVATNRASLESTLPLPAASRHARMSSEDVNSITILDILLHDELLEYFQKEVRHFQVLDGMYDAVLSKMSEIAEEAQETQYLSKETTKRLYEELYTAVVADFDLADAHKTRKEFEEWFIGLCDSRGSRNFFIAVEEWKKTLFVQLSDTLFVVVRTFFEKLLVDHLKSDISGYGYTGRIAPFSIGRKKDFWHRLNVAYKDLQLQDVLTTFKRKNLVSHTAFIEQYFAEFDELYEDRMTSDPCEFPGFRESIDGSLAKGQTPCGVIAGIGRFETPLNSWRVGALISNSGFQAGAFDMASAEKFCRLLMRCAEENIPLVCFISSGGMQTKEGAGALFSMAAVNDRITEFVREFDLPIVIFGFGDCTGGAQASFVTHPLVQTYYLSGTSMPFAGQIVIQSHLPLQSIISNYLAPVEGAMQGLVKHPFHDDIDKEFKKIDPDIPVPTLTVEEVVDQVLSGQVNAPRAIPSQPTLDFDEERLYRPIERVLVHTRGCAAVKIVRTARKHGIKVVLVQSDPDEDSVATELLGDDDRLVAIGGTTPDESYLNAQSVLAVALHEQVDSLHPGIGFLSESSQFAELARSRGINFIGPPVSSMETMGNKSNAISTAIAMGVPVVPGSHGIVTDVETATLTAADCEYPVLIKAVHGGGGKGIQVVENDQELPELFQRVSTEARAAFGNGDVYIEKFVTSIRHIEAQILRDTHGNTTVLGIRDCSVQRNKQKIFEESESTMLPPELLEQVYEHSAAIANSVRYVGAGTVEFIYDLSNNSVYFMEMNTRLQVEHPVTELVSGIDIVHEQFRIASGESIENLVVQSNGYAIEARVNAEAIAYDSEGQVVFRPSAGRVSVCDLPEWEKVEVISTAAADKEISPYYDAMIIQIIAHGVSRESTTQLLRKYLQEVKISGVATNIPLLCRVLEDSVFLEGDYDTNYLDGFFERVDTDELIADIQERSGQADAALGIDAIKLEDSAELKVLAPSTGIFYLKPTPAESDYVSVGSSIDTQKVMCQLEAFKVFSPLRLRDFNRDGTTLYDDQSRFIVKRVNVATGQQVNAGDLLFVVEPVA